VHFRERAAAFSSRLVQQPPPKAIVSAAGVGVIALWPKESRRALASGYSSAPDPIAAG